MAKGGYAGISGKAHKLKKFYLGVGSKARKLKKLYVGIGGKARLWWSGESDYFKTINAVYFGTNAMLSSVNFETANIMSNTTIPSKYSKIRDDGIAFSKDRLFLVMTQSSNQNIIWLSQLDQKTNTVLTEINLTTTLSRFHCYSIGTTLEGDFWEHLESTPYGNYKINPDTGAILDTKTGQYSTQITSGASGTLGFGTHWRDDGDDYFDGKELSADTFTILRDISPQNNNANRHFTCGYSDNCLFHKFTNSGSNSYGMGKLDYSSLAKLAGSSDYAKEPEAIGACPV